jgi:hypothetical protein
LLIPVLRIELMHEAIHKVDVTLRSLERTAVLA